MEAALPGQDQDILKPLSFGKDRFLLRKAPWAVAAGLFGLFMMSELTAGHRNKAGYTILAWALVAIGIGFPAFAFWRQKRPGDPLLVLSSQGVRTAFATDTPILIPWSEISAVGATDVSRVHRGIRVWERDVTTVEVSERFYRTRIRRDEWWADPTDHFIIEGDRVRVVLHHDILSVPPAELHAAVQQRWRAFSSHPNSKLPATPSGIEERVAERTRKRRLAWAAAAAAALLLSPFLWHWHWAKTMLTFPVPSGLHNAYLDSQLNKSTVPARLADGRMVRLWRLNVDRVGETVCRKDVVRDREAQSLMPAYTASALCATEVTMTSGAAATAIMKLVVSTYEAEMPLGTIRKLSVIVPADLTDEEAKRHLCDLRPAPSCGQGM
ncbi:MAG TPA: hypothetical protein VFV47_12590 [Hyphomicrobiaceae bacterium]|nr:hypothetical protein [Hyphomicrobiaceae bacterium]